MEVEKGGVSVEDWSDCCCPVLLIGLSRGDDRRQGGGESTYYLLPGGVCCYGVEAKFGRALETGLGNQVKLERSEEVAEISGQGSEVEPSLG